MEAIKLSVPVRKSISGAELERVLKSIILPENLSCSEKMNRAGSAVGKNFLIHYPEFGVRLVMVISVGDPSEDVICENESYDQVWIEVQKLQNATMGDYLKDLNNPDRDIVTQCQNVRDAYERALAYVY